MTQHGYSGASYFRFARSLAVCVCLFLGGGYARWAFADQVDLSCGDHLSGKIVSLCSSNLVITNAYAGQIIVDRRCVARFVTDAAMQVALTNGDRCVGQIHVEPDGTFVVQGSNQNCRVLQPGEIVVIWRLGEPEPLYPKSGAYRWTRTLALDIAGSKGNSQAFRLGGAADVGVTSSNTDFKLYFKGAYGETEGQLADSHIIGGTEVEHRFLSHHAWYIRDEANRDDIMGISLRNIFASGYGYYFFRDPDHELRIRMGLGHSITRYTDTTMPEESVVTLDSGLRYKTRVFEKMYWNTDITFEPPVNDMAHYYLTQESKLVIPLGVPKLSEEFGLCNQYSAETSASRTSLDTTYFIRTRLSW